MSTPDWLDELERKPCCLPVEFMRGCYYTLMPLEWTRLLAIARAARAAAREWKNVNAMDADWHNTMRVLCEALGASEVDDDGR